MGVSSRTWMVAGALVLVSCTGSAADTTTSSADTTTTTAPITTAATTTTSTTTTTTSQPATTTTIDPVVEPILGLWEFESTSGRNPVTRLVHFFASGQMTFNVDLAGSAPTLGRFTFDGTELVAVITTQAWDCETESGRYRVQAADDALTLTVVDDTCRFRRQVLAQTWSLRHRP